ncbi:HAD-superfamily subfamily IIA hydrolase like protein [Burkholderia humptydooensis MSMB43]|uniref:HAD-superfamily subfamily IIA hydrolase like protein n=1 Tax=Burkholderia humptydooensis MSMB43 TaxID=441157 RepID=A0ABN0FYN8_9BURK|nr:HAD-superfamily subfamily IIA hydrolase like protein [Burkholderia humptydooensis MSMB43]
MWLGKPHPLIYDVCRELLARLGAQRLVAIGDSLAHDIGGGAAAGCDTCFIAGGLHGRAFAEAVPDAARDALLRQLVTADAHRGARAPDWALSTLRWAEGPASAILINTP